MGSEYNFCDLKNSKENEESTALCYIDDINNLICPFKKLSTQKDFAFSQNKNLSIDDYKKISAINKIIKIYREYKKNQKNNKINNNINQINETKNNCENINNNNL